MSRWTDAFKAHAFNANWEKLLLLLDESRVDDETIVTSVEELARLKRVVGYLKGLIEALDPELVPLSTWDSFNSQLLHCVSEVSGFNSNRNIGHIQRANNHADNLISYVRPYMVVAGKAAKGMRDSAIAYSEAMTQGLDGFKSKAEALLQDVESSKVEVVGLEARVKEVLSRVDAIDRDLNGEPGAEGRSGKLISMADDVLAKYEAILKYHSELVVGDAERASLKNQISQVFDEIQGNAERTRNSSLGAESAVEALKSFETRMLGATDDVGERTGGLEGDLAKLRGELNDFQDAQKKKYVALNEQIEGLLPGAASAGLASAYGRMRLSFTDPIRVYSRIFYVSIALLVAVSIFFSVEKVYWFGFDFVKVGTWDAIARNLLGRLPLAAPLVWLAYFASKRRSEYQRLEQEYAHKEALAQSYDSYKKQVDELGGENHEMLLMLIQKAVEAVSFNASSTLDKKHGDNMPVQDALLKFFEKLQPVGKGTTT